MDNLKLGVIGNGFVGSAVNNGFNRNVIRMVVDPRLTAYTIDDLIDFDPSIVFVCVPTPQGVRDVDVSIVRQVLSDLYDRAYAGIVVIKSTITPGHLATMVKDFKVRIVYNPEFLTEANANDDFLNPPMQILGGDFNDCVKVEEAYINHSSVKIVPTFKTDITSASLIKYTINSWLATKVTFFNELYQLHRFSEAETTWDQFTDMVKRDPRIGDTHMQVPGPDGLFGYGGHCLPKDTAALLHYAKTQGASLDVLETAEHINQFYRKKS